MNSIRNIARLNDVELANCTPPNGSWHTDYRDTAFIHIGGLPFDLSEGDVLVIFSQYGSPVHISLARDKDTGKSRGFAWLKYEDQRSADLAVDNLSGAVVLGRTLSVDHARYNMKEGERETVGDELEAEEQAFESEGDRRGMKRRKSDENESEAERPMVKEEVELAKLMREHDDDDPMKRYLVEQKKAEVEEALKAVAISNPKRNREEGKERRHKHRHHHRSRRERLEDDADDQTRNGRPSRKDEVDDAVRYSGEGRSPSTKTRPRSRTPTESDEELDRRKRRLRRDRSGDAGRSKRRYDHVTTKRQYPSEDRSRSREHGPGL